MVDYNQGYYCTLRLSVQAMESQTHRYGGLAVIMDRRINRQEIRRMSQRSKIIFQFNQFIFNYNNNKKSSSFLRANMQWLLKKPGVHYSRQKSATGSLYRVHSNTPCSDCSLSFRLHRFAWAAEWRECSAERRYWADRRRREACSVPRRFEWRVEGDAV